MSTIRVTQVQHEQQECNTSATRPTQVRHKCDTRQMKTYFHILILAIWLMKDYKDRNKFILRTVFGIYIFPCQNAFKKCTTKKVQIYAKAI